jgi:polyferredoxin
MGLLMSHGYFTFFQSGQIYKGPLKGICVPFLSCYACPLGIYSCPIGSLQYFMTIHSLPLLMIGFLGIIGISVGRMTCGWLCPFGLLQDLLYKFPSRKKHLPPNLNKIKYLVLITLVFIVPWLTQAPWFSKLCPMGTLTAGLPWVVSNPPGDIGTLFALKLIILVGFLVLFVVSKRPFCKIACPLGAIFSLFNRFSLVQLEVSSSCRNCGHCRKVCPMDLQASLETNSPDCIRCLNCTTCKHVSVKLAGSIYRLL